ncbi:MAG TPA: hypothetical protein VH306_06060 [Gaiellaceae bacterium]|jgi:DNA-directed RNA polymerase subunit RPC12/RpoP
MPDGADAASTEVVCPHCKKPFTPELIEGGATRYRGYKCPHCRLFVAADRAADANGDGDDA